MNLHFAIDHPSTIELARCQVANADKLVTEQWKRVVRLHARGLPTDKAMLLLEAMLNTLRGAREQLELLESLSSRSR
jgi:rRNA processing protein Krr1/Pno1